MSKRDLGQVYITGADGFIGSHLTESLIKRGYSVTALCLYNSFGHFGWLEELARTSPKNLKIILGDIRDPFFIKNTIQGHNTVIHLAALIGIPYSYTAPQSYFKTNVLGTLNVMDACIQHKVGRFIHTSTSEVYGTAQFIPITEKHPIQGQSPYSASKIGADAAVDSFFRSFALPAVTLRPFNTYGPRQSMRAVIPTLLSQVAAGQYKVKLGNLTPTRDFNFVLDTVEAFISVAQAEDSSVLGQVFNTGTGKEISIENLVKLVSKVTNTKLQITSESERVRPEKSEVERLLSDPSKLMDATGWRPQYDLETGLSLFMNWVKDKKEYLKKNSIYHI